MINCILLLLSISVVNYMLIVLKENAINSSRLLVLLCMSILSMSNIFTLLHSLNKMELDKGTSIIIRCILVSLCFTFVRLFLCKSYQYVNGSTKGCVIAYICVHIFTLYCYATIGFIEFIKLIKDSLKV